MKRPAAWNPNAYIWDGGWLAVGRSEGGNLPHTHHNVQITLTADGPVRFQTADGTWSEYRGAIIRPDAVHAFDGCGSLYLMLFLDPESREGRWLQRSMTDVVTDVPPERFMCCVPHVVRLADMLVNEDEAAQVVRSVVGNLCEGPPPVNRMDPRIADALSFIRKSESPKLSLEEVAAQVHLSPSRFAHLFTDEVGVPFRRYLLWRKLTHAQLAVSRGDSLSAVAQIAGFSDSAHLTRTFQQNYGIAPSLMLGRGHLYEIRPPFED